MSGKWSVLYIYNLIRVLVKSHPGTFFCFGPAKVVLDEYLHIPQITMLKDTSGRGADA